MPVADWELRRQDGWTPQEQETLRAMTAAGASLAEIAAALPGRTINACRHQRRRLGVVPKHFWPAADVARAIAMRAAGRTCAEIGAKIHRTATQIQNFFDRRGIRAPARPRRFRPLEPPSIRRGRTGRLWTNADDQTLRRLHAAGASGEAMAAALHRTPQSIRWRAFELRLRRFNPGELESFIRRLHRSKSDRAIAAAWRAAGNAAVSTRTVNRHRRALGLPAAKFSPTARQLAALSASSRLAALAAADAAAAARLGWPGRTAREAMILDALFMRGPMTRRQICEAVGLKHSSNSAQHLTRLVRDHVVLKLPERHAGRGCRVVYALPITASRRFA